MLFLDSMCASFMCMSLDTLCGDIWELSGDYKFLTLSKPHQKKCLVPLLNIVCHSLLRLMRQIRAKCQQAFLIPIFFF